MAWNRKGLSNTVENFVVQSGPIDSGWYNPTTVDEVLFKVVTTSAQTISLANSLLDNGKYTYIDWGDGTVTGYLGADPVSTSITHNYAGAGVWNCRIISGLYYWQRFFSTDSKLAITTSELSKLKNLANITVSNASLTGPINEYAKLTKLYWIQHNQGTPTGNLDALAGLPLTHIYFTNNPVIYGDLSTWSARTDMTTILWQGDYFTGDTSDLPASESTLTLCWLDGNLLTGDLADLAAYIHVTSLKIVGAEFTGDLASLNPLTSLNTVTLQSFSGSFTDGAVPALNGCAEIIHLGLTSTEVDNLFIRRAAAGKTGGSCNYAGTNAARTSASDAAVATLTGNGVTCTAN